MDAVSCKACNQMLYRSSLLWHGLPVDWWRYGPIRVGYSSLHHYAGTWLRRKIYLLDQIPRSQVIPCFYFCRYALVASSALCMYVRWVSVVQFFPSRFFQQKTLYSNMYIRRGVCTKNTVAHTQLTQDLPFRDTLSSPSAVCRHYSSIIYHTLNLPTSKARPHDSFYGVISLFHSNYADKIWRLREWAWKNQRG